MNVPVIVILKFEYEELFLSRWIMIQQDRHDLNKLKMLNVLVESILIHVLYQPNLA